MVNKIVVVVTCLVAIGLLYASTGQVDLTREDENKTIVLKAIEASDKGDWAEWEKRVAERFVLYGPRNSKPVDREICKANLVKQNEALLKNRERTIHDIIAKDNKVIVRMELTVMRSRVYTVAEPDKIIAMAFTEISIYRLEGGKIVEQWVECDATGFRNDYRGRRYGGWTK